MTVKLSLNEYNNEISWFPLPQLVLDLLLVIRIFNCFAHNGFVFKKSLACGARAGFVPPRRDASFCGVIQ
jgi:hypothetical protein